MAGARVGIVYHPDYLKHETGTTHPEQPERLRRIFAELKERELLLSLEEIRPKPAPLEWMQRVHDPYYIQRVAELCRRGYPYIDSLDTAVCSRSYEVALLAVGGGLAAAEGLFERGLQRVFCALRPPGHHALPSKAMGFCLFNNIAILARYLQDKYGLHRIFILDWDVHHGNGTQEIFYEDPRVFYFSVHQYPHYPGSGAENEKGRGKGKGYTLNVPLRAGSGDADYQEVFEKKLIPAVEKFAPEIILISAGFDPHREDPLSGMQVTERGFAHMTRTVVELAKQFCQGRIISLLEGGYNLQALASSVAEHIAALLEREGPAPA